MKDYVTKIEGAYRIADSRVSLDSVVYAWRDGLSLESIREYFPVLSLEEVYGAITFYLANQEEIDKYLSQSEAEFETSRQQSIEQLRKNKPQLYERLIAQKRQKATGTPEPARQ
ncbi:MAG: DUF433 domain-containing protein [Acidobacteriota bacterium]|nr:MAG: DUF433 domain-containing protein [Acidobacteriota bacterium]